MGTINLTFFNACNFFCLKKKLDVLAGVKPLGDQRVPFEAYCLSLFLGQISPGTTALFFFFFFSEISTKYPGCSIKVFHSVGWNLKISHIYLSSGNCLAYSISGISLLDFREFYPTHLWLSIHQKTQKDTYVGFWGFSFL